MKRKASNPTVEFDVVVPTDWKRTSPSGGEKEKKEEKEEEKEEEDEEEDEAEEVEMMKQVEAAKSHPLFAEYMVDLKKDDELRELLETGEYEWGSLEGDVGEDLNGWLKFLDAKGKGKGKGKPPADSEEVPSEEVPSGVEETPNSEEVPSEEKKSSVAEEEEKPSGE